MFNAPLSDDSQDGIEPRAADDGVVFRFYRAEDWAGVRELFGEDALAIEDPADEETHDFPFGEGVDVGWVAQAGERIVGVVVARERHGHVAYISHLKEHPEWKGREVAVRLASIALRHALSEDCLKVVLYSVGRKDVAADFERIGLLPAGGHGRPGHKHIDFYLDLYRRLDRTRRAVGEAGN